MGFDTKRFDKNKIEWLESDLFTSYPYVMHKIYLRHGGMSEAPFDSLNLSDAVGDDPYAVNGNRELIKKDLGVEDLIFAKQVHGVKLVEVTDRNKEKIPPCDGLYTKEKNIALAMTHADCQAASIYDPIKEIIMVIHAGWKGLFQDIYIKMIEQLSLETGAKPEDLLVSVSPSLGPDHAEFQNYEKEVPEKYRSFMSEKNHVNLWEIAKWQLTEAGVLEKNIDIMPNCTACEKEDFFSYRREKDTGRDATCMVLKG